nr:MarR family transcriptional regulator [Lysinibacter cavernae]
MRSRLDHTINRDHYTPALVSLVSNYLLWGGSKVFRHHFGLGTNEWRILSALSNHPGISASEVTAVLEVNKSIASRSTTVLLERNLIRILIEGGARRMYLTAQGVEVHNAMVPIALERERVLQSGLTEDEVGQLQSLLLRVIDGAPGLKLLDEEYLAEPSLTTSLD